MAATETPAVLDTQKMAHPALAPLYERIQAAASNKLWHQTTVALEELTKDKIFSAPGNTDLLALYSDFIADQPSGSAWPGFASKMSALRLATIGIAVSKQHPDSEEGSAAAIALLEGIGAKLTADKEAVRAPPCRRAATSCRAAGAAGAGGGAVLARLLAPGPLPLQRSPAPPSLPY
jgi:hypothetical protein